MVCDSPDILKVLRLVKIIITIIKIVVPIILIVVVMIDYLKNIFSGDSDLSKTSKVLVSKIITAVLIFLIPTIVNIIITATSNTFSISKCFTLATTEGINSAYRTNMEKLMETANESKDMNDYTIAKNYLIYLSEEDKEYYKDELESLYKEIEKNNKSKVKLTKLVYYYQGDYGNVKFCGDPYNVANNGCGVASMAMIASSYSNEEYDPVYVAKILCKSYCTNCGSGGLPVPILSNDGFYSALGLTHEELFHYGGNEINGNYNKSYNEQDGKKILNAVNNGKSVLLLIPNHYIVLGPNSECREDQVYIYDPDSHTRKGCHTPEEVYSVTYNSGSKCSNYNWCGWHLAIAMDKE